MATPITNQYSCITVKSVERIKVINSKGTFLNIVILINNAFGLYLYFVNIVCIWFQLECIFFITLLTNYYSLRTLKLLEYWRATGFFYALFFLFLLFSYSYIYLFKGGDVQDVFFAFKQKMKRICLPTIKIILFCFCINHFYFINVYARYVNYFQI